MSKDEPMSGRDLTPGSESIPRIRKSVLVAGSGAAGLAAAIRLFRSGVQDLAVITESIHGGTSFNTGSDKQTYYRLSTSGPEPDSPHRMAKALFDGGAMHGDIALAEASGSTEAFHHLTALGVPFPHNRYGGYPGYKTDHDPGRRGISMGPYTSKKMVQVLLEEASRLGIPVYEKREIIQLLTRPLENENRGSAQDDEEGAIRGENRFREGRQKQVAGLLVMDKRGVNEASRGLEVWLSRYVVFALGGPGGLYLHSVYPAVHTGGIGLALEAGAGAVNLIESQFGLASIRHRWNVSGTYQQVIPRYYSTDPEGNDVREFLNPWFSSMKELSGRVFLKGYQWPFDVQKLTDGGSSLVDILVYHETEVLGRRVFLDFRENPRGDERIGAFSLEELDPEAHSYLQKSGALLETPYLRLARMNPAAIAQYRDHGIDLAEEPLEVAVCAQHNNGGLAVDLWWESVSIKGLFPVGEVAGTHGIYRPGGSALNAGQVGALRAASRIGWETGQQNQNPPGETEDERIAGEAIRRFLALGEDLLAGGRSTSPREALTELQHRMSLFAAHIRDPKGIPAALEAARSQLDSFSNLGCEKPQELPRAFKVRQLMIAHIAYLSALNFYLNRCEGGSRGSALVLDPEGERVHPRLEEFYRYRPEKRELKSYLINTVLSEGGCFVSSLEKRRPIPTEDFWFESVWEAYRTGSVFTDSGDSNTPTEGEIE